MARDIPKNDLPTLILAVLQAQPLHGYAIARQIERQSEDLLKMREGSLYPALRILEQDNLIIGNWEVVTGPGPARKVYTLTEAGHSELAARKSAWQRYARAVGQILEPAAAPIAQSPQESWS